MSKEMMKICVVYALEHKDDVKIAPPSDQLNKLRKTVEDLRNFSKDAPPGDDGDDAGEENDGAAAAPAAGATEEEKKKGGLGGALSKGMGMAKGAADKAMGAGKKVTGKVLNVVADGLAQSLNEIEGPFTTVGKDVIGSKAPEIQKVFEHYIGGIADGTIKFGGVFEDPVSLVRGAHPHGEAEFAAAKANGITENMMDKVDVHLAAEFLEKVREEIQKHATVKNWGATIDKYNAAAEKVEQLGKGLKLSPIDFDMDMYITVQIIIEIQRLMGVREGEVRQDPKGKSTTFPETFEIMFSGQPFTDVTYNKFVTQVKDKLQPA